jgi:hypothetical protein
MLQVTYRLKVGLDEFELKADVKDEKEFFETVSFYSNLPKTAPGGATDLKIVFRTTKKGHKYYSLVSESEKQEFKFGQNMEASGGGLFPKGWAPLYQGENEEEQQGGGVDFNAKMQAQTAAPKQQQPAFLTPPAQQQQAAPPQQSTFKMPTPVTPPAAPAFTAPNPQFPGLVNPTTGPTAAPAQAAPAPAANPQVNQVATDVLKRFGISQPANR